MPQKILIIDDADPVHKLVKIRLRKEDVEFHSALDGTTGLAMARTVQPDLILLDIDMPQPDGFEVCRQLKSDVSTTAIPIIFLSAASTSDQIVQGLELGASDYMIKPFEPAEFRARVRAALRMKHLVDLLSHKAMIDGLTELWNRAYFDQRLVAEFALARRREHALSCVMIDIDHFKTINDRFGHPAGDYVLRSVGQVLQAGSRTEDVVCRYGGEEFAIIAPAIAAEGAMQMAERLRHTLEQHVMSYGGQELMLTCSFGVAEVHSLKEPSLVELADLALYRAKQGGRNRVECAISPQHIALSA